MGSSETTDNLTPSTEVPAWKDRNPFSQDVCQNPQAVTEHNTVGGLNQEALDQLLVSVESRSGALVKLLTAPRAGYGKTHLLGRLAHVAAAQSAIVPLTFRSGDVLNLSTLTRRGLESLSQSEGNEAGWTRLRESCGGLIASLLHGLIEEGLVPSANPEQALQVLKGPVKEIFSPEGGAHMIGDWLKKHEAGLCPVLARRAARLANVSTEAAHAWLGLMMTHAYEGEAEGVAEMLELAGREDSGASVWLRLLGLWRPVILMVDHLDGYYRNPEAGVALAAMLMDLVETLGLHVLLSLNQDVWQATFGNHLPSALEDRLNACQILLKGLREADAAALLNLRMDQAGIDAEERREFEGFLNVPQYFLGRPFGTVSARVFLRHCAHQWDLFQHSIPLSQEKPDKNADLNEPVEPQSVYGRGDFPEIQPLIGDLNEGDLGLLDSNAPEEADPVGGSAEGPSAGEGQNDFSEPTSEDKTSAKTLSDSLEKASSVPDVNISNATPAVTGDKHGPVVAPSSDAFVRLREMLHHLRQPGVKSRIEEDRRAEPVERLNVGTQAPMTLPGRGASTAAAGSPAKVTLKPAPPKAGDALLGRFEALRLQMLPAVDSKPLDHAKLADLIRLAGRRFPLVRFSEHELPGLTGRPTMVWAVQGVELVFGLAPFSDSAYWRVLSGFAAGRLTDLANAAEREDDTPPKLKVVTFKSSCEQAAWDALLNGQDIPDPLKNHLDVVHLDSLSLSALYAMQRIIRDAETGTVEAEPTQVMTVLARELDFFWKRITRA